METSKKILWISYIITGILTIVTFIAAFVGLDVMALTTITGLAWGEVIASNAFYFNKAKKENTLKIALGTAKENPDQIDNITAILTALGGII